MPTSTTTVRSTSDTWRQEITDGTHAFASDEPAEYGGGGTAPTPYALLLGALGSCTSMTIEMYARRKQWPLEQVVVELSHGRVHAQDCETCVDGDARIERIERRITLKGPLSEEQRRRLLQIANACPVHRTLTGKFEIATTLTDAG